MDYFNGFFNVVTPITTILTLGVMAYLTKLFADDNNRKQAERTQQANLEGQVQTLTLEAIKAAVRQELKEELATQLEPIKADLLAVKVNQGILVVELRTLGVVKETPILK
jgi:hypothetical protein